VEFVHLLQDRRLREALRVVGLEHDVDLPCSAEMVVHGPDGLSDHTVLGEVRHHRAVDLDAWNAEARQQR
jgi:hypothetical protein